MTTKISRIPSLLADSSLGNIGQWQGRHNQAVLHLGLDSPKIFEAAIVYGLESWRRYAQDHQKRYESLIGDDGILGPHWQAIGLGLRGLLNGDCGPRLDCGTLDKFILDTLAANGCNTKEL